MTNVVALKNLKCIEWTVQTTGNYATYVSKSFSLQGRTYYLEFSVISSASYLYFRNVENQLSQVNVTVRVSNSSKIVNVQVQTFTATNTRICYTCGGFFNSLLTFEVMIHAADLSKDDKSVQISSYKDACFSMESLSHDFSKLLDNGSSHDVEFIVGDKTIKAHKIILCSRSDVFASMLHSDMVEGKTGRVDIQDMDSVIFQQFLKCLYTGLLPELTVDSAFQLYEASDKYGIDSVKKQCSDFLTDNLSPENACEILVLSDRHSDENFKKNVVEFVIKEKIPYMGQKWKDFCQENLKLAVEVYSLFCEQFRPE